MLAERNTMYANTIKMSKQTVLQELKWFLSDGLNNFDESIKVSEIWTKINELLEKEKQQLLIASFYITDFCKCKCGEEVSPSQADTVNQILYDDKRDKVIGFKCCKCGDWIAFPKTCT